MRDPRGQNTEPEVKSLGRLDRPKAGAILSASSPCAWRIHEADISAEPEQAQGEPRLPQADEHVGRPQGFEAAPRQGATPAYRLGRQHDRQAGRGNTGRPSAAARCPGERRSMDGVRR